MRRVVIVLLAALVAGCGSARVVTTTETVTTAAPPAQATTSLLPADPRLTANCQPQPDQPPTCMQGNYQVEPPQLGSTCNAAGDVWEWNEPNQGVGGAPYTAVCAKRDPAYLPRG